MINMPKAQQNEKPKKSKNVPWWAKKWGKDKLCGITQSRLRPGKMLNGIYYTTYLPCGHGFYTNPLLEWVKNCPKDQTTCPVCRKEFDLMDIIRW